MANSGANTNQSQFFITYTRLHKLNNQYTLFGKVLLLQHRLLTDSMH